MLPTSSLSCSRIVSIALTLLMLPPAAKLAIAQATPGVVPYSSYKLHRYDIVSNADLNRIITIPVRSKAGLIPFQANLVMNNNVGDMGYIPQVNAGFQLQISETGSGTYTTINTTCPLQPPDPPQPTTHYTGFKFTDATGAVHSFPNIDFDSADCLNISEATSQRETSGSGLSAGVGTNPDGSIKDFEITDVNWNVFNYNASNPNALVTDKNGNTLSATHSGSAEIYTDSLGQIVLTVTLGAYGPPRQADTYSYLDANGVNQTVAVNYSQYTQQTAWGCDGYDIAPTSVYFPSSISFPDGSSMLFTYENGIGTQPGTVTGRIATITLPTGGVISYAYSGGSNGINCSDGSPATMTRTENGQTAKYVHTTIDQNYHASTLETLPDGGTETFLFAGGLSGIPATFLYSDIIQDSSGNVTSTRLINFNGNPNGGLVPLGISTVDNYSYRGAASVTAGSLHTKTTLDSTYYVLAQPEMERGRSPLV